MSDHGYARRNAYWLLRELGIATPRSGVKRKLTVEQEMEACTNTDVPDKVLARRFNVSLRTIQRARSRVKVPRVTSSQHFKHTHHRYRNQQHESRR